MLRGFWVAVAVAALAGLAYWYFAASGGGGVGARARFAVGGDAYEFDRGYLAPVREDGVVELAAFFPDFSPAGQTADIDVKTDVAARFQRIVFIELAPADPQLDPTERTARLYLRFLSESATTRPDGLVARPFEPGSPFAGDTLYFAPPEGRLFAARCHPAGANAIPPETCVAAFRLDHVDAQLRFPANLLPEWQALTKGAQGLLEIGRR